MNCVIQCEGILFARAEYECTCRSTWIWIHRSASLFWPDSDLWEYPYTSTCTHRSSTYEEPDTHKCTQWIYIIIVFASVYQCLYCEHGRFMLLVMQTLLY